MGKGINLDQVADDDSSDDEKSRKRNKQKNGNSDKDIIS